jgi:hypothetical protein
MIRTSKPPPMYIAPLLSVVDDFSSYPAALSLNRAGVAELVDAAGLGPVGPQGPWRFESSRPHSRAKSASAVAEA